MSENSFEGNNGWFYGDDFFDFKCVIGEALRTGEICEKCPSGKYSLLNDATECEICPSPDIADCPGGSEIVI